MDGNRRASAFHDDSTAVARRDAAVAYGEGRRQRPAVLWTKPQPQQMPVTLGFGPVHEIAAGMKNLVVVQQLDVARFEAHFEMDRSIVDQRRQKIQRFPLRT